MNAEEFSEWLLDQMEERHLNCYQMSKLTGLSHVTIDYYITAKRTPTFGSLKLLLDALGKKVLIVDKESIKEQKAETPNFMMDAEGLWATCKNCNEKLLMLFGMTVILDRNKYPKVCPRCGREVNWGD